MSTPTVSFAPGACWTQGRPLPDERVGELRDSAAEAGDASALARRLVDDGYVFLRDVLDVDEVRAARVEVLERLVQVGEIRPPAADGIATGTSRRAESVGDLGAFWKSVSEGRALRQVTHGPRLRSLLTRIAEGPVRAHDYLFLRAAPVGRTTGLHFDYPFFARATERVCTAWVPLGDVPATDGPLVIVEGSHRFTDMHEGVRGFDVAYDSSRKAQVAADFGEFVAARNCRLLTADFRAGDVCVFGMLTLHGSLDNHSTAGRVRLSCDVRYQPADEPIDPRYFGPNPGGTTGAGYGELNGAKPLTQAWAGSAPAAAPFPLGGSAWRVDEIDGRRVQGPDAPTLSFDGAQRVSGSGGCNRYTASLTAAGSGLRPGEVAMTRMACSPAVMELESRFVTALAAVRGYRLAGDAMELVDESGRLRLRLSRS